MPLEEGISGAIQGDGDLVLVNVQVYTYVRIFNIDRWAATGLTSEVIADGVLQP